MNTIRLRVFVNPSGDAGNGYTLGAWAHNGKASAALDAFIGQ